MKQIHEMKAAMNEICSTLDELYQIAAERQKSGSPYITWKFGEDAFTFLDWVVELFKRNAIVNPGGFILESEMRKAIAESSQSDEPSASDESKDERSMEDVLEIGRKLGIWHLQPSNGRWYVPRTGRLWRIASKSAEPKKVDDDDEGFWNYPSVKNVMNPPPGTTTFKRGQLLAKALFGMSQNGRSKRDGIKLCLKVASEMDCSKKEIQKFADWAKKLMDQYWAEESLCDSSTTK